MSNQIDRFGEYTLHRDEPREWSVEGPNPDVRLSVQEDYHNGGPFVKVIAWSSAGGITPDDAADFGSEIINASQAAKYFTDVVRRPEYNERRWLYRLGL